MRLTFLNTGSPLLARGPLVALFVGAFLLSGAGLACETPVDGGPVEPYAPPGFALPDLNPGSPSYLQTLSPEDARGGVLILYFPSFT